MNWDVASDAHERGCQRLRNFLIRNFPEYPNWGVFFSECPTPQATGVPNHTAVLDLRKVVPQALEICKEPPY